MIDKKELLKELEIEFENSKKELGFHATFEELDSAFSLRDGIVSSEFISPNFSRQLCARILDNFMGWHNYLNGLLAPNSSFLASQTEMKLFSGDEDRKVIWHMIKKSMEYSTTHSLIGFTKDKEAEAKFIDDALAYWNQRFSPDLVKLLSKANDAWKKE